MGLTAGADWIDFSRSFITWLTRAERSYGRFSLEAACTIIDPDGQAPESYYLGSRVVAGRVYSEDHLILTPSYTFQLVAGRERHQIFRDSVYYDASRDSKADNAEVFVDMRIQKRGGAAREVKEGAEISRLVLDGRSLNVKMKLASLPGGRRVVLDFPVKHINVHPESGGFQVETGPVLIPGFIRHDEDKDFNTAYVIFNRLDRAELAFWVPTPVGGGSTRFYSEVGGLDAEIILLAPAGQS